LLILRQPFEHHSASTPAIYHQVSNNSRLDDIYLVPNLELVESPLLLGLYSLANVRELSILLEIIR
jgi:hypothetical protein